MKRIARDEIINAPEHRSRRSPSTPTHLGLAFASFVRSRGVGLSVSRQTWRRGRARPLLRAASRERAAAARGRAARVGVTRSGRRNIAGAVGESPVLLAGGRNHGGRRRGPRRARVVARGGHKPPALASRVVARGRHQPNRARCGARRRTGSRG